MFTISTGCELPATLRFLSNLTNCSILEMYVGIICACLPSLKALIKRYFPGFFKDNHARLDPGIPSFDVATPSPQQQRDSSNIFEGQTQGGE